MSIDLELSAKLDLLGDNIGRLAKGMGGIERAMRRPPAQPFAFRRPAAGVAGAADLVIDLGGPQSGRYWNVMGFTAGGTTWATVAAGVGLLVVSSAPPVLARTVGIDAVYDAFAALPAARTYSRGQVPVNPSERVYLIVTGGTNGLEYHGAATIQQYEAGEALLVAE